MLALLIPSISMLHTKLCALTRSINHLWIVVVSLCVNLVGLPFEYTLLLHWLLILVWNGWDHLLAFLDNLVWTILILKILEICSPWCNNSFLGISIAHVVVAVSLRTCDSVSWASILTWLLICKLNKLLWVLVLHHQGLLSFRCLHTSFIEWYVYSAVGVAYNLKKDEITLRYV